VETAIAQSIGGLARLVRGQESGARWNGGAAESAQGSGVKARGSRSGLDEVVEDSQDLLGIGDNGEDPHLGTTAGAAQRVNLVNLCEQSCPGGAGLLDRHGLIQGARGGRSEAQSRLRLVVLLPPLWSQAGKVGLAGPCAMGARGIQPVATNQAGAGVRKVLQDLDKELCGGEQLGLCVEVRIGLMLTLHLLCRSGAKESDLVVQHHDA